MHEIIHLSLSSEANGIHSHFYNSNETYFVFGEDVKQKSLVDPFILFTPGVSRTGGFDTYTPRSLIWDMRGGYGSLKRFNSLYDYDVDSKGNAVENGIVWTSNQAQTIRQQAVNRGEYQKALDQNQSGAGKLNTGNTMYWTDYLNIYYHPKSLLSLNNWEVDPMKFPQGRSRGGGQSAFKGFDVGVEEWNDLNFEDDYLETNLRPILENCDLLAGISVTTEVDSAWSGLTSEILTQLQDEHLPKTSSITWGLFDDGTTMERGGMTLQSKMSRIKATAKLAENSTVFIPLSIPRSLPATLTNSVDASSVWHRTAVYNMIFESVSVISCLRDANKRISMDQLVQSLLGASRDRNVVSEVNVVSKTLHDSGEVLDLTGSEFTGKASKVSEQSDRVFSKYAIERDNDSEFSQDIFNAEFDRDVLQENGTLQTALNHIHCDQSYAVPDSYPQGIIAEDEPLYSSLAITNGPRKIFKSMGQFVSKYERGDDREELKDQLSIMAGAYEWGWESDGEEFDD